MLSKQNLLSLAPFVLTWQGTEKGTDRYYAWPVPLPPKKERFVSFLC